MDILMKISDKTGIEALDDWNDDSEEYFWRGREPDDEPTWVYFVDLGCIIGKVLYSRYEYVKGTNSEGEEQDGDAFILKGPLIKPSKPIKVPKDIMRGSWRWRYLTEEIIKRINLNF